MRELGSRIADHFGVRWLATAVLPIEFAVYLTKNSGGKPPHSIFPALCGVFFACFKQRTQAAEACVTCQPGNTSTAGWQRSAMASALARSTPRLTRPFSMLEMVVCGIPHKAASWVWLKP